MISFTCPQCGKHFQVGDELAGKMGKCKSCGGLILVPPPNMQRPQPVAPQQQSPLTPMPPRPTAPPPQTYAPPQQPYGQPAYPQQQPAYGVPSPFSPQQQSYGVPTTAYEPPNPYGQPQPYVPPSPYPTQQYPQQPAYSQPQYPGQSPYPQQPFPGQPAQPGMDRTPVRMKRLQAEAAQVQKAFASFPNIRVQSMQGEPPERYVIEYRVRGLVRSPQGPVYQDQHYAEIQLTSEYPRQSPKCRMLTPIFHPNFEPATICVGDHWTAGERLVDLIIRIAEMIAFQQYNIKSPLDGEAAMWTDQNRQHLPTDRRDMRPPNLS